ELGDHLPELPRRVIAGRADLVGYGSGVLEIRAESSVDGDAHDVVPSLASSRALSSRAARCASTRASLRNTSFAACSSSSDDGGSARISPTVCSSTIQAMARPSACPKGQGPRSASPSRPCCSMRKRWKEREQCGSARMQRDRALTTWLEVTLQRDVSEFW